MRLPSALAFVIGAFAAFVSASCATTMRHGTLGAPTVTSAGVRFALDRPEAHSVAVAGSFNQWSASSHTMLRRDARSRWTILVPLPPGEHLFMYVVDGTEWISPPAAEDYADDGFGAKNGIVVVR